MSKLYRVAFDVERRAITHVLDELAGLKTYDVEWLKAERGSGHRVAFMVETRSVPFVLDLIAEIKAGSVDGPTPAQEVSSAPLAELIDLRGKTQVTTEDLRNALIAAGRSPLSTSYFATQLREARILGKGNSKGVYPVLVNSAKRSPKKKAKKAKSKGVKNGEK